MDLQCIYIKTVFCLKRHKTMRFFRRAERLDKENREMQHPFEIEIRPLYAYRHPHPVCLCVIQPKFQKS